MKHKFFSTLLLLYATGRDWKNSVNCTLDTYVGYLKKTHIVIRFKTNFIYTLRIEKPFDTLKVAGLIKLTLSSLGFRKVYRMNTKHIFLLRDPST